jgi:hypothetical protein
MDLFVLTYGRATPQRQHTLRRLSEAGLPVRLVVQAREWTEYAWVSKLVNVMLDILPENILTVAPTRQFITDTLATDKFVMMDDDLHFFKRRDDDRTKFRDMTDAELVGMFQRIEQELAWHMHVGIASREGGNRNTEEFLSNTRIMRLLGYKRSALIRHKALFDEMEVMEDFHVALTLLRAGRSNLVLNDYCHNQAQGSAAPGGCSHFRTPELHEANAYRLAKLHAPYVTTVKKETKTAWGGGTRTDVRVQWKKAYNDAL